MFRLDAKANLAMGHDKGSQEADQHAEQRSGRMEVVLKFAEVKAELSYLNSLEERCAANVASLTRLKEACDALLGKESEVAAISTSRRL